MALDKEIAQDLIDDFVLSNDDELNTISTQNPALFDATLNALNFLSSRFGTGQKIQIVEKPKVAPSVLPFKDGDKFKVPEEKSEQTYTLKDIDLFNGEVRVSWYSLSDKVDKSYLDSIQEVTKRINDGNWVLVDEFPYKVGDTFSFIISGNKEMAEIKSIDGEEITFVYPTINNNFGEMQKSALLEQISKGNWVLINAPQFELGQILYDENEQELFKIREITSNGISLISAKGHIQFKATGVLEKKIGNRGYILATFKIGDVFTNANKDIITINDLAKTNQNDVELKWVRNGKMETETRFWDGIETNIYDGVWIPLLQTTPILTNNPNNIKIGDLIFNEGKVFEILDINQNDVKMMTSNNTKLTGSLGVLNAKIKDGENIKLAFSIGDTYVNPDGDFYKIMELYPNNERSLYVKVNENPNLELFQWDLLEDFVSDGYWVRGTKADADEIKANLSQAKPNATQAKMAQVTATPTKTPKKRLTKLEKEIKDLQEEIDGLLFLADEDDEAKADLEKKLIQIEALKTKKP
jgi:hypothetical protein